MNTVYEQEILCICMHFYSVSKHKKFNEMYYVCTTPIYFNTELEYNKVNAQRFYRKSFVLKVKDLQQSCYNHWWFLAAKTGKLHI